MDSLKCQTFTVTPAKPGVYSLELPMVRTVLHSNSSVITHLHEIGSGFYGSEVET